MDTLSTKNGSTTRNNLMPTSVDYFFGAKNTVLTDGRDVTGSRWLLPVDARSGAGGGCCCSWLQTVDWRSDDSGVASRRLVSSRDGHLEAGVDRSSMDGEPQQNRSSTSVSAASPSLVPRLNAGLMMEKRKCYRILPAFNLFLFCLFQSPISSLTVQLVFLSFFSNSQRLIF